jgi:hypothetical protein
MVLSMFHWMGFEMHAISKRILLGLATSALLLATGCGGGGSAGSGGDEKPTASPNLVRGVASKGPLQGSTVCAFAIVNNAKSSALGTCAANIANGAYSIDIGTYTGPVLLEVLGGSYIDEASGATAILTAPLRSMIGNAAGGTVSAAITPLTELAFQDANSLAAGLSLVRMNAAIQNVQTKFGVADIVNTQPVDALSVPADASAAQKTYALALATISQFQNERSTGTSLAAALQTIRVCLADASTCGAGTKAVGGRLMAAMTQFQSSHTGFAGMTLNVATIDPAPSVTCTLPLVVQSGACVLPTPTCVAPQVLQNGTCTTLPPTCTLPQVLQNGVCVTPAPVCSAPQVVQGNLCVTPAPTCPSPQVLQNGACVSPTAPTFAEQPYTWWEDRPIPQITPQVYGVDLRLCGPDCVTVTTVFLPNTFYTGLVSNIQTASTRRAWNGNASVTRTVMNQVSRELDAMLTALWTQRARPDKGVIQQAITQGFSVATTPGEVTSQAAANLSAGGFPTGYVASGTGTGGTGGTGGTETASACTAKAYTGATTDVQTYMYDYIAQIDQCLYRATGNANYIIDGDRQCALLSGWVKTTGSSFRAQYCSGTKLIR